MSQIVHYKDSEALRTSMGPSVQRQLDVIWLALDAIDRGNLLPTAARDMITQIIAIQAKYPYRESTPPTTEPRLP
jgi:hypothetical protein